jgi:hypothetical protein
MLELDGNLLSELPVGIIQDLPILTVMSLSNKLQNTLNAGLFQGVRSLTDVRLDNNLLRSLPAILDKPATASSYNPTVDSAEVTTVLLTPPTFVYFGS